MPPQPPLEHPDRRFLNATQGWNYLMRSMGITGPRNLSKARHARHGIRNLTRRS